MFNWFKKKPKIEDKETSKLIDQNIIREEFIETTNQVDQAIVEVLNFKHEDLPQGVTDFDMLTKILAAKTQSKKDNE